MDLIWTGGWCDIAEEIPRAKKYRKLAADARAEAEKVTVPQAKQVLLAVAADYERLADTLEANARRAGRWNSNWDAIWS